ncbi:MAG: Cytosol aminopeptidase [Legionellaceae bacterium]
MEFQSITLNEFSTTIYDALGKDLFPADCLIVGIFENQVLSPSAKMLDTQFNCIMSQVINQGDIQGELGQTLLIPIPGERPVKRILLVGCGKPESIDGYQYRKMMTKMTTVLMSTGSQNAICFLPEIALSGHRSFKWKVQHLFQIILENKYTFASLKTNNKKKPPALNSMLIPAATQQEQKDINAAAEISSALDKGITLARNLGNLPGNICTPTYLAEQAFELTTHYNNLKVTVFEKADMQILGMGALLAVAQGSDQPPKLITIEYQGSKEMSKPIVFVGKGITFDSGGISLKPGLAMDEMKYDMCGAASVLGLIKAVAELQLPINIVGVIPATENLPSGKAVKPGDIVKSMAGKTIEILNTDAEGRLILCDALTFCNKFNPEIVIDIATLTGAVVIALGNVMSGLLSNNQSLANELYTAGEESTDLVWQLPIHEDYQELLNSNFADIANIAVPAIAGSITAACFLSQFTKDYVWAHLDIAGTAWKNGKEKGATGRPISLLLHYLLKKCGQ